MPVIRKKGKPGLCGVCASEHKPQIELGLVHGIGVRVLADRFGVSKDSIWRHSRAHLGAAMRAAYLVVSRPTPIDLDELRQTEAEGLLGALVGQRARLQLLSEQALAKGLLPTAAAIEGKITASLELTAKLTAQLMQHHVVTHASVLLTADYMALRHGIIGALKPFPDAAMAVGRVLHEIESRAAQEINDRAAAGKRPRQLPPLIEVNGGGADGLSRSES